MLKDIQNFFKNLLSNSSFWFRLAVLAIILFYIFGKQDVSLSELLLNRATLLKTLIVFFICLWLQALFLKYPPPQLIKRLNEIINGKESQQSSNSSNILSGFDSSAHLLRFCLGLAVIGLFAFVLIISTVKAIKTESGISIEARANAIVLTIDPSKSERTGIALIPANQLWVDTGIILNADEEAHITATGSVNLSIHRTIEAAIKDKKTRLSWVGPDGGEQEPKFAIDNLRLPLRLMEKAGYGCLLGYIKPVAEPMPDKDNPKPSGIFKIGKNLEHISGSGSICLTVNDIVLKDDEASKRIYIADPSIINEAYDDQETVKTLTDKWNKIIEQKYFDIWYDDNAGSFLVQISIKKIGNK